MPELLFAVINIILKIFSSILIILSALILFFIASFFEKKYKLKFIGKKFYFPFFALTSSSLIFPSIYYKDKLQILYYFGGISSIFLIFFLDHIRKNLFKK